MIKLFTLLLLAPLIAGPTDALTLHDRIANHTRHFLEFAMEYYGCPKDGTTWEDCDPKKRGHLDYALWNRACESAKALWQFKGDCR